MIKSIINLSGLKILTSMDRHVASKRKMSDDVLDPSIVVKTEECKKKIKGNNVRSDGFSLTEISGDLFTCGENCALAHCISQDIKMGKGIAVIFKNKFGGVQELLAQKRKPGDVAILKRGPRFVYYLITKVAYFHKPTYTTLRNSLEAMKRHALQFSVPSIAMPRIGCGLDHLSWNVVKPMIADVFQDTDISIYVYYLE